MIHRVEKWLLTSFEKEKFSVCCVLKWSANGIESDDIGSLDKQTAY